MKLKLTALFIMAALAANAADTVMDRQVADFRSAKTTVELQVLRPASQYFVAKDLVGVSGYTNAVDGFSIKLVTAGGAEYAVPVTREEVKGTVDTNLVVQVRLTPGALTTVSGGDKYVITCGTNTLFRFEYDLVSRGIPRGEGLDIK